MKNFNYLLPTLNEISRQEGPREAGQFYAENRLQFLNAAGDNTVAVGLKRQVVLREALPFFVRRLAPLRALGMVFNDVPLEGTDKMDVPFYDLEAAASTDFNPAQGYVQGETNSDTRELTVDKRKYQSVGLTSAELARQPALSAAALLRPKSEKLALDIFQDVLSIVTAVNYGAAIVTKAAALFGWDDLADIRTACNNAHWPELGRSLVLGSDYDGALAKDDSARDAINARLAKPSDAPKLLGFDYYASPNVPENGEKLVGIAAAPGAMMVGLSPVTPAPNVRAKLGAYEVVTDPETGISFTYKSFGNAQMDNETHVIECSYGYALGNANALKRVVKP